VDYRTRRLDDGKVHVFEDGGAGDLGTNFVVLQESVNVNGLIVKDIRVTTTKDFSNCIDEASVFPYGEK